MRQEETRERVGRGTFGVHGEERDELGQPPAVPERLRGAVDLDVPEHRNLNGDASPRWPRSRLVYSSRSRQRLVPGSRTWSRMTLDLWRALGIDTRAQRAPRPRAPGSGARRRRSGWVGPSPRGQAPIGTAHPPRWRSRGLRHSCYLPSQRTFPQVGGLHTYSYTYQKRRSWSGRVSEFRVSLTSPDLAHPPQQEVSPQDAPGAAETPGGVQHQPEPVTEPLRQAQSTALHAASGS